MSLAQMGAANVLWSPNNGLAGQALNGLSALIGAMLAGAGYTASNVQAPGAIITPVPTPTYDPSLD